MRTYIYIYIYVYTHIHIDVQYRYYTKIAKISSSEIDYHVKPYTEYKAELRFNVKYSSRSQWK